MRAFRVDLTPGKAHGRFFDMFITAFTTGGIIDPLVSTYICEIY